MRKCIVCGRDLSLHPITRPIVPAQPWVMEGMLRYPLCEDSGLAHLWAARKTPELLTEEKA